MDLLERDILAPDGRNLRVREAGDPDGFPVFVHHGTPMAGCLYEAWVADAREQGIRLLSHDRPGYGFSDPHPGRKIADVAADVKAITDHLELERFATWGASGGGPHALACGALLSGRVTAVAIFAGIGPFVEGLDDFLSGMGEDNVTEFTKAQQGRDQLEPLLEEWRETILSAAPGDVLAGLESIVSEVDAAALTGDLATFFYECDHVALRPGIEGWVEDDLAFVGHWGFGLDDVRVPVQLWQGGRDLMVPMRHGRWMAERLPDVDARLIDEEGHITLVGRLPEAHTWLKERG